MIKVKLLANLKSVREGMPFEGPINVYSFNDRIPTNCLQLGARIVGIFGIIEQDSLMSFPTWKVVGIEWNQPNKEWTVELDLVSHQDPESRAKIADHIEQFWN